MKSRHGHYSDIFEEEAKRIKQMYKDMLNIDISWVEATAIAARRSSLVVWDIRKLKTLLSELRGL